MGSLTDRVTMTRQLLTLSMAELSDDRALRLAQTPPQRAMRTSGMPGMCCSMCRADGGR